MSDKFRLFKAGWDRDCLFNIHDGDRIIVRWEDGTETFEKALVSSDESWGREQGSFLGQSYMGTHYELFAEKLVHGRKSRVSLDGLWVYAESMDTFEEFKAKRAAAEEERRQREMTATHLTWVMPTDFRLARIESALDKLSEERKR